MRAITALAALTAVATLVAASAGDAVALHLRPHPLTTVEDQDTVDDDPAAPVKPPRLRIAHVTDLHLDPHYDPTADADTWCHARTTQQQQQQQQQQQHAIYHAQLFDAAGVANDPWSLRPLHPVAASSVARYGRIGSPCDAPMALVKAAIELVGQLNVDAVLWSGDTARHDRDNKLLRPEAEVYAANAQCAALLANATTAPVFPTVGNLDVHPHNQLAPPPDSRVLPRLAASLTPVLRTASARADFASNGAYVADLAPTLALINVNAIYWMAENARVPDCTTPNSPGTAMADWLDLQLSLIAHANRTALVMGHVPPASGPAPSTHTGNGARHTPFLASNYKPACATRVLATLDRYAPHVAGMFGGHVNDDATLFVARDVATGAVGLVDVEDLAKAVEHGAEPGRRKGVVDGLELRVPVFAAPSVIPVHAPAVRVLEWDPSKRVLRGWWQYYLQIREDEADGPIDGVPLPGDGNDEDEADPKKPHGDKKKKKHKKDKKKKKKKDKKKKKKKKKHRKHKRKYPPINGNARWVLEYSTRRDYGMKNLTVAEWAAAASGDTVARQRKQEDGGLVVPLGGDGGRRGAARAFRVKYQHFREVKGPFRE
ncbi:Endopolyphosphatase [Allomyces arbusculus]|nr:Endopolyphosphatase [Allomyces arbusculus]